VPSSNVNSRARARTVSPFRSQVAVITGAGAGIGQALAIALARQGAQLALCDIDAAGLDTTAGLCGAVGVPVLTSVVDVTDRSAMTTYAAGIALRFGRISYVFNNAGVILTGRIDNSTYDDIEHVVAVDFWGVVNGTKAFLPYLIESGGGHLINISSAYGLIAAPAYSAYCAAKFAVRGFTEAIQQEMLVAGYPVNVSCVYPGAVRTSIMRAGRYAAGEDQDAVLNLFDRMARTSPDQAASTILRGVIARHRRILVGPDAGAADVLARVTGTGYQRVFQLARSLTNRQHRGTPARRDS